MPLYEYRCAKGHDTEIFHSMAETPSIVCEICGRPAERVLSPPMIHTQYHFSPQVHGARKPRYRPEPEPEPAEPSAPAPAADAPAPRTRGRQVGGPKASS